MCLRRGLQWNKASFTPNALLVAHEVKSMTYDRHGECLSGGRMLPMSAYAYGGSVWDPLIVCVARCPGPAPPGSSLACTPHLLFNRLIKSYFTAARSCQMIWETMALLLSVQADCIIQMDTVELLKITRSKQTETLAALFRGAFTVGAGRPLQYFTSTTTSNACSIQANFRNIIHII